MTSQPQGIPLLLEPVRAMVEAASLPASIPALAITPRGDGRVVMVLPGYAATDHSTGPLRLFLTTIGYRSRAPEIGRNRGFGHALAAIAPKLLAASDTAGEPISLVGWSLGGTVARELARRFPERVRDVVTMGSPVLPPRPGVPGMAESDPAERQLRQPCTVIFSRSDAIVPAAIATATTTETPAANYERIEVNASHLGLGVNPGVYFAVADRLAAPVIDRQPFRPPALLRPWYG